MLGGYANLHSLDLSHTAGTVARSGFAHESEQRRVNSPNGDGR